MVDVDVAAAGNGLQFDHIHMYADAVEELSVYKELETRWNAFDSKFAAEGGDDIAKGREIFASLNGGKAVDPSAYQSSGRDVVRQLVCGAGFRVTGYHDGAESRSVIVTTPDASGAKFVVTAPQQDGAAGEPAAKRAKSSAAYDHFASAHLERFKSEQAGRQGVAALAFNTPDAGAIARAYAEKHPALVVAPMHEYEGGTVKVFEAFAYYQAGKAAVADRGTVLRFVEYGAGAPRRLLPGLEPVEAAFPTRTAVAYSDHWVSNVVDRKQFLSTLEDTLGFRPKVDFNAGVVAAGEAIIESTVTGNAPAFVANSPAEALPNQQQIYLPINNALSEVGHVHLFIEEIGQGIQHIASRIEDLPAFISLNNAQREMTGEGFSFLRIPRSYYGIYREGDLAKVAGVSAALAGELYAALRGAALVDGFGAVNMDITDAQIADACAAVSGFAAVRTAVAESVRRGRYNNMYALLGDHFDEAQYLKIVQNHILVDLQAGDVLFQIFTSCILQREAGVEAPFLEFIQRVCSAKLGADGKPKPVRPGCGGFGIRNFLTLFLSIEVSKAMTNREEALAKGDAPRAKLAGDQVRTLTEQLDVSNPVLTDIAEAMTAEADALAAGNTAAAAEQRAKKEGGNERLKTISAEYKAKMGAIREEIAKLG
eukprot:g547.t1